MALDMWQESRDHYCGVTWPLLCVAFVAGVTWPLVTWPLLLMQVNDTHTHTHTHMVLDVWQESRDHYSLCKWARHTHTHTWRSMCGRSHVTTTVESVTTTVCGMCGRSHVTTTVESRDLYCVWHVWQESRDHSRDHFYSWRCVTGVTWPLLLRLLSRVSCSDWAHGETSPGQGEQLLWRNRPVSV
jgi:hypothetical protein